MFKEADANLDFLVSYQVWKFYIDYYLKKNSFYGDYFYDEILNQSFDGLDANGDGKSSEKE
jgi:hypothetical protein